MWEHFTISITNTIITRSDVFFLFSWCLLWWCHKKKITTSHYEADGGEDAFWLPERGIFSFQTVTLIASHGWTGRMGGLGKWLFYGSYFIYWLPFVRFNMRSIRCEADFSVWLGKKNPQIVCLSETIIKN